MVKYPKKEPLPPDADVPILVDGYKPYPLRNPERFKNLQEAICKKVSKATPIRSAFLIVGLSKHQYGNWRMHERREREEHEPKNEETLLMRFFNPIYEADKNNEAKLSEVMFNKAVYDEDIDATKYLLDKRHKWKETKQVEVDNTGDTKFELNIVPMEDQHKKKEDDE